MKIMAPLQRLKRCLAGFKGQCIDSSDLRGIEKIWHPGKDSNPQPEILIRLATIARVKLCTFVIIVTKHTIDQRTKYSDLWRVLRILEGAILGFQQNFDRVLNVRI